MTSFYNISLLINQLHMCSNDDKVFYCVSRMKIVAAISLLHLFTEQHINFFFK